MQRRKFIQNSALFGSLAMINPKVSLASSLEKYPVVRTPKGERNFESKAIEKAIKEFGKKKP